jgi:tetratricopeptide (TPR) repeat protein
VSAILEQASKLLRTDPARAESLAREALAAAPSDPRAWTMVAAALRGRGEWEAASEILKPLAAVQSSPWIVHFELACALVGQGRSRAAVAPLSRAVELNPALTEGWRLLGDILLVSGDVLAARRAFDHRVRSMIRDPRLQAAAQALAEDRPEAAETGLRSLLGDRTLADPAAQLLAEVLRRSGRRTEAEALLRDCLLRVPDFFLARQSYALALHGGRRFAAALAEIERLLARDPGDTRSRLMKAAALTETGEFAAAIEVSARVLQDFPDQPRAWLVHGNGLRTLGRIEESIAAFRRCLELDPACAEAFWSLANLKTYRFADHEVAAMTLLLARGELAPQDRTSLHFALGKAREDAGAFGDAFEHFARANRIERGRRPYFANQVTSRVAKARALFTPTFFAQRLGWGVGDADPIFIVGLPRSGSTLVEQILASHPAVEGTRELPDIRLIAERVAGSRANEEGFDYAPQLAGLRRDPCAGLGAAYLDRTRPLRLLGRPRFTDKAPENFLHIGLIHLILPRAKIIDVRRHPLACCWSAYKQHYAGGFAFTYDLTDVGRYYADYVNLMAHFDDVLPGRVHRVIYEDLVADAEAETRRLLAHLDLPFEPACLRFFDTPRAVVTPSSEQVRQPIFTEAVGQWRAFEPWLDELKQALGPALDSWRGEPQSAG